MDPNGYRSRFIVCLCFVGVSLTYTTFVISSVSFLNALLSVGVWLAYFWGAFFFPLPSFTYFYSTDYFIVQMLHIHGMYLALSNGPF